MAAGFIMGGMSYSRAERLLLEQAVNGGTDLRCPSCGGQISAQAVPAPPGVSYVRQRVWLVCLSCKKSASVDKR